MASRAMLGMTCTAARGAPASSRASCMSCGQGQVGVDGLLAALEDHGVAALQTEGGGVHRDVGPGLIDKADHPQGDALPAHLEAVGAQPHAGHRAHRIRQGRHFPEALDHGGDDLIGQGEAVDEGGGIVLRPGRLQVLAVFRLNRRAALLQQLGHPEDNPVLDGPGKIAQLPCCGLGFQGQITNQSPGCPCLSPA